MKKYGLILIWFLFCFSGQTIAEETISLANGEWDPYFSENLKYYGVASRIISEAFGLEGIKVNYEFIPWKRGLENAKFGDIAGAVGWGRRKEREVFFLYSDQLTVSHYVFFHLKSYSFDWKTIDDLEGIDMGGTIGYSYGEAFTAVEKASKLSIERVPTDEINYRKLLIGRIFIFPNDLDVGYQIIQKSFAPKEVQMFTHHPKPLMSDPIFVLFSKKVKENKRMLQLFNKGLKRLRTSGKYDQYFEESRRGEYIITK